MGSRPELAGCTLRTQLPQGSGPPPRQPLRNGKQIAESSDVTHTLRQLSIIRIPGRSEAATMEAVEIL